MLKWSTDNWMFSSDICGCPAAVGTRKQNWISLARVKAQFRCLLTKCHLPRWTWSTTQKSLIQQSITSTGTLKPTHHRSSVLMEPFIYTKLQYDDVGVGMTAAHTFAVIECMQCYECKAHFFYINSNVSDWIQHFQVYLIFKPSASQVE